MAAPGQPDARCPPLHVHAARPAAVVRDARPSRRGNRDGRRHLERGRVAARHHRRGSDREGPPLPAHRHRGAALNRDMPRAGMGPGCPSGQSVQV
ncbi:hypothetical protein FH715_02895 [Streptomyces sedi]|uniref:Uncharacterized protein n=1 Tax=Streptomyces sedi TaxID=555059 RepID=A0A5C4VBP9_9ACTN|nr:hypothetical protein FH715_02895 [Streptomyces sedi]